MLQTMFSDINNLLDMVIEIWTFAMLSHKYMYSIVLYLYNYVYMQHWFIY